MFVVNFTVAIYGHNTRCPPFLKFVLLTTTYVGRFCMSLLAVMPNMCVDNNVPNCEALLRKELCFISRLSCSTNMIIRAIENYCILKHVI